MSCPVKECPHKKAPCDYPRSACESAAWLELRQAQARIAELEGRITIMAPICGDSPECPTPGDCDAMVDDCTECWKQWAMKGGKG
jgi:hypothetical protein